MTCVYWKRARACKRLSEAAKTLSTRDHVRGNRGTSTPLNIKKTAVHKGMSLNKTDEGPKVKTPEITSEDFYINTLESTGEGFKIETRLDSINVNKQRPMYHSTLGYEQPGTTLAVLVKRYVLQEASRVLHLSSVALLPC
jgi:hypothetical protein